LAKGGRGGFEQGVSGKIDVKTILDNISPLPRSETLEWKRATDLIEQTGGVAIELPLPAVAGRTVSPLTRGNVLHRCLEDFTKTGTYDLDRIVGEHPEIPVLGGAIVGAFKEDVAAVLERVLNNAALAWIFAQGPGAYSELPFIHRKGHAVISGIIDRVVIQDRMGFVVDYKSILIENDEALGAWKEHYRPQIGVYCEAVKEIFKLVNVEGHLLFLDSCRLEAVTRAG
jgi:hypothetical protein